MKKSNIANSIKRNALKCNYLLHRFKDEVQGVAAIEFCFLAPIMLVMYVGTIEVSAAVSANRKLSRVSSTLGDLLSQEQCYSNATVTDIMNVAEDIMYPYDQSLEIVISGVSVTGTNATVDWSRAQGTSPLGVNSPYTVPTSIKTDGNFLVAAKINMTYTPIFGWLSTTGKTGIEKSNSAINMEEELFLRPRIGDSVIVQAAAC